MRTSLALFVLASGLLSNCTVSAAGGASGDGEALLAVYLAPGNRVAISFFDAGSSLPPGPVIVIRSEEGQETWRAIPAIRSRNVDNSRVLAPLAAGGISRDLLNRSLGGDEAVAGADADIAIAQLQQLTGGEVLRGDVLLTPSPNSIVLSKTPTIRRVVEDDKQKRDGKISATANAGLKATTAVLKQGRKDVARINFDVGESEKKWSQIEDLPGEFSAGLTPGEYALEYAGGTTKFSIADDSQRGEAFRGVARLQGLLNVQEPLYVQVVAEHLISNVGGDQGRDLYLADALDLIDSLPCDRRTEHLRRLREQVIGQLRGQKVRPVAAGRDTGVAVVDEARHLIAGGEWNKARALLTDNPMAPVRHRALCTLYRAVILAQAGQSGESAADKLFQQAIAELGSHSEDLYRAYINYANFLVGRALDQLHNQAVQIAAKVPEPLTRVFGDLETARALYESALQQADTFDPSDRTAVHANLGRLYAILADAIRAITEATPTKSGLEELVAAANWHSVEHTNRLTPERKADAISLAVALEVRARLAFREEDYASCQGLCSEAMAQYLEAGSLLGVESVQRLMGLIQLGLGAKGNHDQALSHLMLSHELAEVLRNRFPGDKIGRARSGFLARRTFVNEKLVELLVGAGRNAEALHYAELAKARALQDLLLAGNTAERLQEPEDISDILRDWPEDVAALEYYLGSTQGWVFLVTPDGKVNAWTLRTRDGQPVVTPVLVRHVVSTLKDMDHWARSASRILAAGRKLNPGWQEDLHELYGILVPEEVREQTRLAKTLVIVPHHVLHYLPFAALVTRTDPEIDTPGRMLSPSFMLDEPFDIIHVPSLTSWRVLRSVDAGTIREAACLGIVDFPSAPSLPGVEKDIDALRSAFGEQVRSIDKEESVTEATARQRLAEPGLLLIATHGLNNAEQPLASYLLLHGSGKDDGRLTAREIYANAVHRDLVVMGACYSGLADRSPLASDDLFGLQRALLQSGARSVVSSCWDVYDGTAPELMSTFFHELRGGKKVAAALAGSQRSFLNKYRARNKPGSIEYWLHPYFWAVYTVTGDDRTAFALVQ